MSGRRHLVWSTMRRIQRCERCHGPLDLCQPDESRPHVLIGVCRDGCRAWYLMIFPRGDQARSDRPLSCVPCQVDPPPPPAPDHVLALAPSPARPVPGRPRCSDRAER